MLGNRLGTWLRWLRATATFVFIAALCLAVAVLVIALIPGSPVTQELPAAALTGLGRAGGVTAGVDPSGWIPFTIHDPSLAQRLLHLLTVLPGLVLVAEIARRMANLLRGAQASDPFTANTARALVAVGKLTAFAGLGAWILSQIAQGVLSWTMLTSSVTFRPHQTPLGWLAVGLIFAAFGQILDRGVTMRAELDTVI
jgi:ABC-type amino acid transport substrate-binding protein